MFVVYRHGASLPTLKKKRHQGQVTVSSYSSLSANHTPSFSLSRPSTHKSTASDNSWLALRLPPVNHASSYQIPMPMFGSRSHTHFNSWSLSPWNQLNNEKKKKKKRKKKKTKSVKSSIDPELDRLAEMEDEEGEIEETESSTVSTSLTPVWSYSHLIMLTKTGSKQTAKHKIWSPNYA